ncbi:MAG: methyltransferase domain-containing protein [Acidobacteria bacterium]|nr:methyltransferase domain-containing protein [Acidobacteriota bacterium]
MTPPSPTDPLPFVYETVAAFQKSRVLLSAVSAGVFEALAPGALTLDDLAARTGTHPRPLRMVLDVLVGLGFLAKTGPAYANTALADAFLVPGRPRYLGDIFRHQDSLWSSWSTLSTVLRTGAAVPRADIPRPFPPGEQTRHFIQGMKNLAVLLAPALLSAFDLSGRRRLLDLGGGPGWHSLELCRKHPQLEAVVFDHPDVAAIGRENVREAGLAGRVRYVEGDFLADDVGSGFDCALVANIIHSYSQDDNRAILRKAAGALVPGGLLAVVDFFVDEGRTGPMFNLLFAVNMLVNTEGGDTYPASDVRRWLVEAGLETVGDPFPLNDRSTLLLAGKPAREAE